MSKAKTCRSNTVRTNEIPQAKRLEKYKVFHIRVPAQGTIIQTGCQSCAAVTQDEVTEVLFTHRGIFAVTKNGDKIQLETNDTLDFVYNGDWGGY